MLATPELPLCILMVESQSAMADLPETLKIPGVDGIYVGPRDLSLALGRPLDPADPVLRPAFERVWALCAEAGKPVGVHSTDGPTARLYRENGCRLVTVVNDNMAIKRESAAGRPRPRAEPGSRPTALNRSHSGLARHRAAPARRGRDVTGGPLVLFQRHQRGAGELALPFGPPRGGPKAEPMLWT